MKNSLRSKIAKAKTEAAITKLLKTGEGYQYASAKTRRRWKETATQRKSELG